MSAPAILHNCREFSVILVGSASDLLRAVCGGCGRERQDGMSAVEHAIAHTQAQRLAAMYPTPEPEPAVDPRTAAEDRCRTFWESCTQFEKATLRWLSGVGGWTDAKALDVRTREWRRGK